MNKQKLLLILILLFGLMLRVYRLSEFPAGFTADEASHGYDAYSLLLTGKDQWGHVWPLAFESFGDFKLPAYSYLTIPFIAFLGLNEFAIRLPGALLGTVSILMTYLFTKRLFAPDQKFFSIPKLGIKLTQPSLYLKRGLTPPSYFFKRGLGELNGIGTLPLFAALFLAISPWHVQLSRGAFEANLTSFFLPAALWAWLKGLNGIAGNFRTKSEIQPWIPAYAGMTTLWWLLAAFLIGINLYTYHAARAFTLVVLGLISWFTYEQYKNRSATLLKYSVVPLLLLVIFLIPMWFSLISGSSSRGLDVAIFNPTDHWQAVMEQQQTAMNRGVPLVAVKLFFNKATYVINTFAENYLSYLSPRFLFVEGPGEASYGMIPGRGVLHWFELPLLLIAVIYYFRHPSAGLTFLLCLIVLAPLPAALTKGDGLAANRAATMIPFIHIFSAYGAVIFVGSMLKSYLKTTTKLIWLSSMIAIFFGLFLFDYFLYGQAMLAKGMAYGWHQTINIIKNLPDDYEEILLSRSYSEPHIFPALFTPFSPVSVQRAADTNWVRYRGQWQFLDQLPEYQLDKYRVHGLNAEDLRQPNILLIGKPGDFPTQIQPVAIISRPAYPESIPEIMIVDPMADALVVIKDNQVVLIKGREHNEEYGLPFGLASTNKSRFDRAREHLQTMTGLTVEACKTLPKLYSHAVDRPLDMRSAAVKVHLCIAVGGQWQPNEPEAALFVKLEETPQLPLLPNVKEILNDIKFSGVTQFQP